MEMEQFLRLVLPDEGFYCWVSIRNKKVNQGHVATIEDLAGKLRPIDAEGSDAYVGCASYKEPTTRKQDNVLWVKSFWLDIDCGKGKEYEDIEAGSKALTSFCTSSGLSFPLCVCSGYGLHCWFILAECLNAVEWRNYAEKLQNLCKKHGFKVDPSRTRDCSSVLRPPDTHNYKHGEIRAVSVLENKGYSGELCNVSSLEDVPGGVPEGGRTTALTKRAGSLILHGKTLEETIEACQAWNKNNLPPLEEEEVERHVKGIWNTHNRNHPPVNTGEEELPVFYSWSWSPQGELRYNGDSEQKESVIVTSRPIFLSGITRKEHSIDSAYIFRHFLPIEGWKEVLISASDFHSASFSSAMAKEGLSAGSIKNYKFFKNFIHMQLEKHEKEKHTMIRYEQFGWKNDKQDFLTGKTLYTSDGRTEQVPLSADIAPLSDGMGVADGAVLSEWRQQANQLMSQELYPMGVGLVCSFAAPILGLCLSPSDGGIVLHCWSKTGRGKSKIIDAVDTVWGTGRRTVCTASDTLNALFRRISVLNNLPVQIDEFNQNLDPNLIAQIVKRFTVGRDKSYLKQNRDLVLLENNFQTVLITTANRSMLELIGKTRDDGAYARVVEILIDTQDSEIFKRSELITRRMAAHGGIAGKVFIEALVKPQIREAIQGKFQETVLKYHDTGGPERRYINRFLAAVEIAGKIITGLRIMEFDVEALMRWLISKMSERPSIENDYRELMGQFITEKSHECLSMAETNMLNPVAPRNVNMRYERYNNMLIIPVSYIKEWCITNNISYQMLKNFLIEENIYQDEVTRSLTTGTTITSGKRRCWRLDSKSLISSDGVMSLIKPEGGKENASNV